MAGRFHLISLGCAKNLVDSEVMLGGLASSDFTLENEVEDADFLIVNTCGFIQPAVEEAISEILELVSIKDEQPDKKIIVVGCLVQRYKDELLEELPEVDLFVGTEAPAQLGQLLLELQAGTLPSRIVLPGAFLMDAGTPRVLTTPHHRAWMKITEGCNNRCSYCMIPSIRGKLRSRSMADLGAEAKMLEARGVKEISLIAQDSTAYGRDLDATINLEALVRLLLRETAIPWLRLLYLYPTGITDSLIDLLVENERITPYLDIPFQHVCDRVLQRMNRPYGYESLVALVEKLRAKLPHLALRTTFLVGFPGESEEEFLQIEKFMRDMRIDHVGIFPYANEQGCPAENYPDQIEELEKLARRDHLLEVQASISTAIQEKYIGMELPVLVEGVSPETDLLLEGRTQFQAPEVDGCVYINDGQANAGEIVQVKIAETKTYDLIGGVVAQDDAERI